MTTSRNEANKLGSEPTVTPRPAKKTAGKYGPKAKLSFRRGYLPPLVGIAAMLTVLTVFNGQLIFAQLKYHYAAKSVATVSSSVSSVTTSNAGSVAPVDTKSPHPELGPLVTMPSISVDAPVIFEKGTAEWQLQIALRSGVVHYAGSVQPGDTGNVVLFGHSSGQPWAPGKYKFVFTLLDKLKKDDLIYIDNGGTRFTYKVVGSQVVAPTNVSVLTSGSNHELTLITCTPVGTSTSRLVVHAEQISPSPTAVAKDGTKAANNPAAQLAKPLPSLENTPAELPGSASQSFWSRLRNLF